MKKLLYILVAAVFVACQSTGKLDRSIVPQAGPAPKIQIGTYQLKTLPNGMKLIVVENHKLPRVSINMTLDIDPFVEGAKAGYAEIAGDLMSSGTASKTKAQIDEAVDFMGASLSTSSGGVFGGCLKKHTAELVELMADVTLNPTFPEEELEKLRTQLISSLANETTDPDAMSGKIQQVVNYGANHPYGEFKTEQSVKAITREDILSFYQKYVKPNVTYCVVVGDINMSEAEAMIGKAFKGWKSGEVATAQYAAPKAPLKNIVSFVPLEGAVQSVIDVTYPIQLKPGTQDAIVASVLNNILGGNGFQTRLMQNLREDKAYTYGAYSSINADEFVGAFSAGASVRNEVTDSAVTQILFEMQRLVNEPVSDTTLKTVKNIMTGNFARSLERPQTVANFALNIERYGLPKDYYETYLQKLNAVTIQDVQNMAKKLILPSNANITIVGNKEVASKLSGFGELKLVNADGSEYIDMKPAPEGVTAESVLRNYINALGGEKNIQAITSYVQTGKMTISGQTLNVEMKSKDQRKIASKISMGPMEFMKQTFDGVAGVASQMGTSAPMSEAEVLEMKMMADLCAEIHYNQYGITPTLKGVENFDGQDCYVLELKYTDGSVKLDYYRVSDGLKVRSFEAKEMGGEKMTIETKYMEYRMMNGVQFISKLVNKQGPQVFELVVNDIQLNVPISDDEFKVK
ncbi:MAG: insulinase family protein [Flavobacteriales bacterium]